MACVMFLCTTALAADIVDSGDCGYSSDDKVTWTLYSDGTLKINGYGSMANYDDTNRPPWEAYSSSIKTVSVSGGVSSLGAYAFYNYKSLKSVTINSALTINKYAFANSNVKNIELSFETRSIDPTAFSGCTYLVEIKCGDDMYHYSNFPDGNFPTSYYTLISYLCQGRQFVKYSPNRSAQYKCSIPNAMTSIAPYAFADLQYLNEVGIPASVQEIGANAFSGDSLKNVVFFGEAPQDVADNAFNFTGTIHCFCRYADSFRESSLYSKDDAGNGSIPWEGLNIKKLVVGEGCTSICEKAFWNKSTIEEAVFLCDTLTIKKNAFSICDALKSADFSKCGSLTLGDMAFSGCTRLSSITFNDSDTAVIKLGQYVFNGCTALSTVHLPKGVTMDGTYTSGLGMFSGCTSLRTATVDCAFIGPFTFECRALDRITFTDPNVQFYYFHDGKGDSGHPINVECQTELVGYDCSEVHKLANEQYKPNDVSLTFKQIEGDTGKHKLNGYIWTIIFFILTAHLSSLIS